MISFSLFSSGARQLVGLDISSSSVKMLELAGGEKDGYRLERYAIEPLPRDAVTDGNIVNMEAVAEAIRRAVRRMGGGIKNAAVALPASAVITKKILLPAGLREQEIEAQVESEASQYIPFAIDEVNLDFQILGDAAVSAGDVEVLIAASRKEKVDDRVAAAELAGLKVTVVDVETFAAQAAFSLICKQMPGGGKDEVFALIDIGASLMSVTVLRNGQQAYTREQAFGGNQLTLDIARQYGMSPEEAEAAKRTGNLPEGYEHELLRPFMDSVALEVSRALQFFFTSTQFNHVDHVVLSGGCSSLPGLAEIVEGRTQVNTLLANPFAGMSMSNKIRAKNLQADAPSLMVACGLALRRFDP